MDVEHQLKSMNGPKGGPHENEFWLFRNECYK